MSRDVDLDLLPSELTMGQVQACARAFGLRLRVEVLGQEIPAEPFIDVTNVRDLQHDALPEPRYNGVGPYPYHVLLDGVGPCIECGDRGGNAIRGQRCPGGKPTEPVQPLCQSVLDCDRPAVLAGLCQMHHADVMAAADEATDVAAPASDPPSEGEAPVSMPDPAPVQEQPVQLCKCGCGQPVVNAPRGRRREYAGDACRKRHNGVSARRARTAAAGEPEMDPATPVVEAAPAAPPPVQPTGPRSVFCVRCEQDGHYVEDCAQPMNRPRAKAPGSKKVAAGVKEVITCGRCLETGHSIFTCTKGQDSGAIKVPAPVPSGASDDILAAHGQDLLALCKDGLPDYLGYSVKPDVLALYGLDQQLLDAALRNPERVEIRPEGHAKTKRYCILSFQRGDVEVILGMRAPATPAVIAAYANSRLQSDSHRVGHAGAGSSSGGAAKGLPKSARQVVTRLRAMGGRELEVELDITTDFTDVVYKGQNLGKISCDGDRQTSEQDYQRIQRKMAAIDRRVAVG